MTRRLLPPSEWHTLAGTELETVWPLLHPERARVIVVEDEGRIVGTWAAIYYLHAEGVWTDPAHRKRGAVARHLLRGMREIAAEQGESAVMTGAASDDIKALLDGRATKLPDQYVMRMGR